MPTRRKFGGHLHCLFTIVIYSMKNLASFSLALVTLVALFGCTQEKQNEISRSIQNWSGTDGVLDIYAGDKLVLRFIKIDKLSTAYGTDDKMPRPYRYGYGYVDVNQNFIVDNGEKKVYFEISDYSTNYVFYENYKN
jgi:hypothetical protein